MTANVAHSRVLDQIAKIVPVAPWQRDLEAAKKGIDALQALDRPPSPEELAAVRRMLPDGASPTEPPTDPIVSAWRPVGLTAVTTRPEPRQWLLRHPTKDWAPCDPAYGDGMLPLGKAGLFSAAGGEGKTSTLIQLGVCSVTGRRWLDHFVIDPEAQGRRVVLALAEEDGAEVDRRMFAACEAMELSDDERELVAEKVIVLPLAGEPVALLESEPYGGEIHETPALLSLRRLLSDEAHPLALVVLDPLARWAGADAESDSRIATRLIQAVESLTRCPGGPTVIVAHHSSKLARRAGDVDARGVTAITDGLRWAGTLRADGEDVMFRQSKSNYSRPMPHELRLVRGAGGVLTASAPEDAEDRARAQLEEAGRAMDADVARVVAALAAEGSASSVDGIAGLAGMRLTSGRRAVRLALDRGVIVRSGSSREPIYRVREETPIPPGTSGRPADGTRETSNVRGFGVRDVEGRRRDVGTSSHWIERVDP